MTQDGEDERGAVFEQHRPWLTRLARRLVGAEAEDVVQDAWLRLTRVDAERIDNLPGWLRTVVTRLCLDRLRSRTARREVDEAVDDRADLEPVAAGPGPEAVAELSEEAGQALLVVLETLTPVERVTVVVHDMFEVPYADLAPVVGKSVEATKRLAARARSRVRGQARVPAQQIATHRRVVTRFLEAAREGDVTAVMGVLAPDVVRTADPSLLPPGVPATLRGARAVAEGTAALAERSQRAELALVDGDVGLVVATEGRLELVVVVEVVGESIGGYRVVADPEELASMAVHPLPGD